MNQTKVKIVNVGHWQAPDGSVHHLGTTVDINPADYRPTIMKIVPEPKKAEEKDDVKINASDETTGEIPGVLVIPPAPAETTETTEEEPLKEESTSPEPSTPAEVVKKEKAKGKKAGK